jgi:hypothetical protein
MQVFSKDLEKPVTGERFYKLVFVGGILFESGTIHQDPCRAPGFYKRICFCNIPLGCHPFPSSDSKMTISVHPAAVGLDCAYHAVPLHCNPAHSITRHTFPATKRSNSFSSAGVLQYSFLRSMQLLRATLVTGKPSAKVSVQCYHSYLNCKCAHIRKLASELSYPFRAMRSLARLRSEINNRWSPRMAEGNSRYGGA